MLLLLSSSLQAQTPSLNPNQGCYPSPQPLISACRAAIAAHDKEVADANAALQKQIELTNTAVKNLAKDDAALVSWTHNPTFLVPFGFLVGVLATGWALKK